MEPCFVCGTDTELVCSGCDVHSYCSVECQREDWIEHEAECKDIAIDAPFRFRGWRGVISEHARLVMERALEIAFGKFPITKLDDKLKRNLTRWRKGRDTNQIQILVTNFNEALRQYSIDLDEEKLRGETASTGPVVNASGHLGQFFEAIGVNDAVIGFFIYHRCLLAYARDAKGTTREDCMKIAKALGVVLNGRAWHNPTERV